jgi:hypothetical protein
MRRIALASRRFLQVPIAVVMIVAVVAVDGGTASGSVARIRTSDACRSFVLGRGGFGTLQHCRSFGRRDIPLGSERNGSGQFVPGVGSTATITWAAPFEGSTATMPTVVGLANVSFDATESDPDVKGSCPTGTFEEEMTADVVSGDDTGGTFRAELCSSPAGGLPFTEEPNTKARITEP